MEGRTNIRATQRSEAYFTFWIPGQLDCGCGDGLLAGQIDRRLPVFVGEAAVDIEIVTHPLDGLEAHLIERRSTIHIEACSGVDLSRRAGNEVLGDLLVSAAHLD